MEDPLSDVLRLIRVQGCVYFARDFWSPWGMHMDSGPFAQFHAIVRGDCVVEAEGARYLGRAGDIFLFPRGQGHALCDRPGRGTVAGVEYLRSLAEGKPRFADGEKPTQLVCGHFAYRNDIRHPAIEQLPEVIHIKSFDILSPGAVDSVLPLLVREMARSGPGAVSVVERLAEVLLVQILRVYFAGRADRHGFVASLSDPRVARAISTIHAGCGQRVTLDELARVAGMSRSAFAQHFKDLVGLAPIEYLVKWRMCRASEMLRTENLALDQVAEKVGYESAVSFSRAFKREFDISPGEYRHRSGPPAAGPTP